jgi:hypothetical protein
VSRHSWLDNSVPLTNVGRVVSHVPISFPLVMVRFFKTSHSRDISLNSDSYSSTFRSLQAWMTAVPGTYVYVYVSPYLCLLQ